MMRMTGYRMAMAIVAMLVLVAAAAYADCPYHKTQTSTGYSSAASTCQGNRASSSRTTYTGSTYLGQYEEHDARCLFNEIRADHRAIKSHLDAIANGARSDRGMHWAELRNVLLPHMQAEERVLYPALEAANRTAALHGMEGEEEHAAAAAVFQKLDGGDMTSDRWTARFIVFRNMVTQHIAHEEDRIFDAARHGLSSSQLAQACSTFMEQRRMAAASLPSMYQPASYQSSVGHVQSSMSDMQSPIYGQCPGFDQLGTSNMTLRCSSCGEVVGTVTPVSEDMIMYGEAAPETPTAQTEPAAPTPAAVQPAQPAQPTTMNQAPAGVETTPNTAPPAPGAMPMGTMQCPHCGAAMGSVCPYSPAAPPSGSTTPTGMESQSDMGTGNQMNTGTSAPTTTNNEKTRY